MKKLFSLIALLLTVTLVSAQDNTEYKAGMIQPAAEMSVGYVIPNLGDASNYVEKNFLWAWILPWELAIMQRKIFT